MASRTRKNRSIKLSPRVSKRKAVVTPTREVLQVGRNQPCPCGSSKKYKDCHVSEGERFLTKIAKKQQMERLKEERQRLQDGGVPWYKRVFTKG